jgi:hypothetical protein
VEKYMYMICSGEPVVVEWKKSAKQKPRLYDTYDAPLQLAAYLGAMNFDPTYDIQVFYNFNTVWFYIYHAPYL